MEEWNGGMVEWWNVEALAEIPLRRENGGRMEECGNSTIEKWKKGRMRE